LVSKILLSLNFSTNTVFLFHVFFIKLFWENLWLKIQGIKWIHNFHKNLIGMDVRPRIFLKPCKFGCGRVTNFLMKTWIFTWFEYRTIWYRKQKWHQVAHNIQNLFCLQYLSSKRSLQVAPTFNRWNDSALWWCNFETLVWILYSKKIGFFKSLELDLVTDSTKSEKKNLGNFLFLKKRINMYSGLLLTYILIYILNFYSCTNCLFADGLKFIHPFFLARAKNKWKKRSNLIIIIITWTINCDVESKKMSISMIFFS